MTRPRTSTEQLIRSLQERAKELNCLYRIEEVLRKQDDPLDLVFSKIVDIIPPGWQYPDICRAKITFEGKEYKAEDFEETEWVQNSDIIVHDLLIGNLKVYYIKEMPAADYGPFLKEEAKLINTITERIGLNIMHRRLRQIVIELESTVDNGVIKQKSEWPGILKMLKQTDRNLYLSISRKMLNQLCWTGVSEAEKYLQSLSFTKEIDGEKDESNWNLPLKKRELELPPDFGSIVFKIAAEHISDNNISRMIQKWIQEDKLGFLTQTINRNLPLADVADAIRRYHHLILEDQEFEVTGKKGIIVSLIRRFLSAQLIYIKIAKSFFEVNDFYNILQNMIFTVESHGKLGGKSAGLYLANQILKSKSGEIKQFANVKIPKTWHITSDTLFHFLHYNDFNEMIEQKYKDIDQVRLEYPHIEQLLKSGRFPNDIIKGLSMALDDLGDSPLIVRSSSLLEDQVDASFAGKYKSLFLANQGTKQERLDALMDAVAEVYSSTFGPDPIEYRTAKGLIDFDEEMGIMVQQVVGTQIGRYFLPAFAGVALSNNEFRWSPKIKREDGLVRLVPGLGTRAVDRLSDDFPILISPGQPKLRVNVTPDEVVRYSPKQVDVIDLEKNCFVTLSLGDLLKEAGHEYPALKNIISLYSDDRIQKPVGRNIDFEKDEMVVTFEGLLTSTDFMKQMSDILSTLKETLKIPVEIEFASDGRDFYLLQCRPQCHSQENMPSVIPKDVHHEQIIFSADRYISNGYIPNIKYIVYVDPGKYEEISDRTVMLQIGRAVGKLNKILPRRQFILMGPGRWGSRGNIKLGVNVTYSDINNTAALIEIALRKGNYLPELSFGTHFFQDLVEAKIFYLPLYPDEEGIIFNKRFLLGSKNILAEVLTEYTSLSDVLRLIDVGHETGNKVVKILMNADLDEALAIFGSIDTGQKPVGEIETIERPKEDHWRWRMQTAMKIASSLDPNRFGVTGFYVFGSTKNATAGPGSDIDILIHFTGSPDQREKLTLWLEGWNLSLSESNYLRTGYRIESILDVHIITDKDIERQTSYATKIGAITDPAKPLPLKRQKNI